MAELSPRQHFLQVSLKTIMSDVSQDQYVLDMLQGIIDFVRDDTKWNSLSAEERQETQELLTIVNRQMTKVADSKAAIPHPESRGAVKVVDTLATQSFRGGLINALFRLRTKAENAAKEE
jgi:hypothetical protein